MEERIREKVNDGRELRNKVAKNTGVKAVRKSSNEDKRAKSCWSRCFQFAYTLTLIVLQFMAMAKTLSLFTANNEIYFLEPKYIQRPSDEPTAADDMMPPEGDPCADPSTAPSNCTGLSPLILSCDGDYPPGYEQLYCEACPSNCTAPENPDDPANPAPEAGPQDLKECYGRDPRCGDETDIDYIDYYVLDNSVYCFVESFTFELKPGVSLDDMQGKTLLRIVRPLYDANRQGQVRTVDDYCVDGTEGRGLGNSGWGNDYWRTSGFKSLQLFFVMSTSIMMFYDLMKACNIVCPRTKGKGGCCRQPYTDVVGTLQHSITDRGYRRRYDGIDWDMVINECENILSKAWHTFIYVFVYYPLNFVTSALMSPGSRISTAGSPEVAEVESYEFLMTMIVVMNYYMFAQSFFFPAFFWYTCCSPSDFILRAAIAVMAVSFVAYAVVIVILYCAALGKIQILHIFFGFNFNFEFPSPSLRWVGSLVIAIGVLRFAEAVVHVYYQWKKLKTNIKVRKGIKALSSDEGKQIAANVITELSSGEGKQNATKVIEALPGDEGKYMDFFVRLVYDISSVKPKKSNAKMSFSAHMKFLSKNRDFYYLGSHTSDQADDTVFFVVLKFKRPYTRKEVETLLVPPKNKSSSLCPKITFSFDEAHDFKFDNVAAEQKAMMSKPHIVHVKEQVFRPFCFDRWLIKKLNTKDFQRKKTEENQEKAVKYEREENFENDDNEMGDVEMV